jgi:myo-inositol-1(or 4)-monophosphatase
MNNSSPIDYDQALQHSIHAARLAGTILMDNFGKLKARDIYSKKNYDFVTEVDKAAEQTIIEYLRQFYPDFTIHAEESGIEDRNSALQWLIDPLDGTKNYINSFPIFSVSIALQNNNEIVAGVLFVPFFNELFTAVKGKGAYLNGEQIYVSDTADPTSAMIATGFPHAAKNYLDLYLECFRELFLKVSAIRRAGSAAIDLAYTACGRFDGFWEFNLNPWDMGAGVILIQEAGGMISSPSGDNRYLESGNVVAGNPVIYRKILDTVQPIWEKVDKDSNKM